MSFSLHGLTAMARARLARAMLSIAFPTLLLACGGGASGAFGPTYPDNQAASIDQVAARLRAGAAPDAAPVAVGLTNAPHHLYAVDLATGSLQWKVAVQHPASAPQIGGPLVYLHETRGIVARDLATGAERFVVEDDALHLAGRRAAKASGRRWRSPPAEAWARVPSSWSPAGGSLEHEIVVEQALGAPTVAAGMVFVPWATQNLSVLDAESGDELARVRITDTPVARAFRVGDDLYFGQRGVFRFTPSVVSGLRAESAYFEPMAREIPGDPALMVDPYRPTPTPDSALHRIRFVWRPSGEGETMRFADDTVYAVFYRFVFALDPDADAVRWIYQHPEDIVGAVAHEGGVTLAGPGGRLRLRRRPERSPAMARIGRRHSHGGRTPSRAPRAQWLAGGTGPLPRGPAAGGGPEHRLPTGSGPEDGHSHDELAGGPRPSPATSSCSARIEALPSRYASRRAEGWPSGPPASSRCSKL